MKYEIQFDFSKAILIETMIFVSIQIDSMAQSDGADDEDESDVIILSGCGQNYRWKFPKDYGGKCPVKACLAKCEVRSDAIDHYKKYHAMNAMYCKICRKPIATTRGYSINFQAHNIRMHPGINTESYFDSEPTTSKKPPPPGRDVCIRTEL